jgi:hypothetical protein
MDLESSEEEQDMMGGALCIQDLEEQRAEQRSSRRTGHPFAEGMPELPIGARHLWVRDPRVHCELNVARLAALSDKLVDRRAAEALRTVVCDGVDMGFRREGQSPLVAGVDNPVLIRHDGEQMAFIRRQIEEEDQAGRLEGPYTVEEVRQMPLAVVSPVFLVAKGDGGWRMVHDLSHVVTKEFGSVNDHLRRIECKYSNLAYLLRCVARIAESGNAGGARIWKADYRSAYRHLGVRPDQVRIFGFFDPDGRVWFDRALPFGAIPSAGAFEFIAKVCNALVVITEHLMAVDHYLDDTYAVSPVKAMKAPDDFPHQPSYLRQLGAHNVRILVDAEEAYSRALKAMEEMGWTLSKGKLIRPATRVKVLAVVIDTQRLTVELPPDKRLEYLTEVRSMLRDGRSSRRQLESLMGQLGNVSRCGARAAAAFLASGYGLLAILQRMPPYARISLTEEWQDDLRWWEAALEAWDGVVLFRAIAERSDQALRVECDAADSGFGGCSAQLGVWFAAPFTQYAERWATRDHEYAMMLAKRAKKTLWSTMGLEEATVIALTQVLPPRGPDAVLKEVLWDERARLADPKWGQRVSLARVSSAWRELFALLVTITTIAPKVRGRRVAVYTDNQACAYAAHKFRARAHALASLARSLALVCLQHSIKLEVWWLPTGSNVAADALSRFKLTTFLVQNAWAAGHTQVQPALPDGATHRTGSWRSTSSM